MPNYNTLTEEQKDYHRNRSKNYYYEHREERLLKVREYQATPKGQKTLRKRDWKRRGMNMDNFDDIYEKYLNSEKCESCGKEYTHNNKKCLDHSHTTGEFRGIICNNCNIFDRWKKIQSQYSIKNNLI